VIYSPGHQKPDASYCAISSYAHDVVVDIYESGDIAHELAYTWAGIGGAGTFGKWASVFTLAIRGVRVVLYEVGLIATLTEFGPGQGRPVAQLGWFSCTDGTENNQGVIQPRRWYRRWTCAPIRLRRRLQHLAHLAQDREESEEEGGFPRRQGLPV
jgi:hypothetical protein